MVQPTIRLSDEQVAAYHRDGFLALPALTTAGEVDRLRGIYDKLFASRTGREVGDQFDLAGSDEEGKEASLPQILGPSKYAPELNDTLLRANAAEVARRLGGAECVFRGDHAINKPARSGAATPWHQDEAYWPDDLVYEQAMSIWVPFQDVDERNGCMQFIKGSHHLEVLPHHSINNDPRVHGLELDAGAADVSNPAIRPIPAGGCTIHPSRTLHYTAPNHSDAPRRAYIMIFHTPARKLDTPRGFRWNQEKQTAREQRAKSAIQAKEKP